MNDKNNSELVIPAPLTAGGGPITRALAAELVGHFVRGTQEFLMLVEHTRMNRVTMPPDVQELAEKLDRFFLQVLPDFDRALYRMYQVAATNEAFGGPEGFIDLSTILKPGNA